MHHLYAIVGLLVGILIGIAVGAYYTRRHMLKESDIIKLVHAKGDQLAAQLHQRVGAVRADVSKVQSDMAGIKSAIVAKGKAVAQAVKPKKPTPKAAPKKAAGKGK